MKFRGKKIPCPRINNYAQGSRFSNRSWAFLTYKYLPYLCIYIFCGIRFWDEAEAEAEDLVEKYNSGTNSDEDECENEESQYGGNKWEGCVWEDDGFDWDN